MDDRASFRLEDIKTSIVNIRTLLDGRQFEEMYANAAMRAAFERFLEILSEASRHIPEDWKLQQAPDLPWRQIADLGNTLRHAYHRTDAQALWTIYTDDLDALEIGVDRMLDAYARPGGKASA